MNIKTMAIAAQIAWVVQCGGAELLVARNGAETVSGLPADADRKSQFAVPPFLFKSRPLWFWNGPLSAERTRQILGACQERGYSGVGILPATGMSPAFMTPEFLDQYQVAADHAASLGMKLCLYDEYWFPSGSAGGLLAQQHPEALSRRLDLLAVDATGPQEFARDLPAGVFMGAVAMNLATLARTNLSHLVEAGRLAWFVPAGDWKIMIFTCVPDGARGLVDYLDPAAVRQFISLTYEAYYRKFPEHFGTTIDSAFYDEPTFHWVQGGRAWTAGFNEAFRRSYGYDPVLYYPALWYDIGPETAAARNALFGLRAALYATGFPKVLNDWCRAHRIQLTGHADQEEVVNPVGLCGDLMKSFRHQDIPAIDQIGSYGRASKAYKIVSSAACNYDRPLVLTECYGAMDRLPVENLYREAMDQFAKGINMMVPHAVWYEPKTIIFQPDLSPGNATYGPHLQAFNSYIGRLQLMLQGGRHVADIAVLYPIATLQAGYYFGPGKPYEGGVIPPEADYMDLGERLALDLRRDFTFLHPETLDERCSVQGPVLRLNNRTNAEEYRVFIIPGSRAIHWSSLRKIKTFYDQGGIVLATTRLPDCSAEFGHDADVRQVVEEMFGKAAPAFPRVSASSAWKDGGYDPVLAADGDSQTRWNAADGSRGGQWLEVDFGRPVTFDHTVVREVFDRTTAYGIESWDGTRWVRPISGARLGPEKTDRFKALTASKVRLGIDRISSDSASIAEFEIYDAAGRNLALGGPDFSVRTNTAGGRAYFTSAPRPAALRAILNEALPLGDVRFEPEPRVSGGNLACLHKVAENRDLYFFANSSNDRVDTFVRLRGRLQPEAWDPHTGLMSVPEFSHPGEAVTRVRLVLEPVKSLFLVAPREPSTK